MAKGAMCLMPYGSKFKCVINKRRLQPTGDCKTTGFLSGFKCLGVGNLSAVSEKVEWLWVA
eukprot:281191-Chlamydomonas_euryale.AAC.3